MTARAPRGRAALQLFRQVTGALIQLRPRQTLANTLPILVVIGESEGHLGGLQTARSRKTAEIDDSLMVFPPVHRVGPPARTDSPCVAITADVPGHAFVNSLTVTSRPSATRKTRIAPLSHTFRWTPAQPDCRDKDSHHRLVLEANHPEAQRIRQPTVEIHADVRTRQIRSQERRQGRQTDVEIVDLWEGGAWLVQPIGQLRTLSNGTRDASRGVEGCLRGLSGIGKGSGDRNCQGTRPVNHPSVISSSGSRVSVGSARSRYRRRTVPSPRRRGRRRHRR